MDPGSVMDKNQDPGCDINIPPDPQHCPIALKIYLLNKTNIGPIPSSNLPKQQEG
jgi:hypothetical protein